MLFKHWVRLAASRTFCTAGNNNEINTPMMAITTRSSIRVNPDLRRTRIIENLPCEKGTKKEIKCRSPKANHELALWNFIPGRVRISYGSLQQSVIDYKDFQEILPC